MSNYSTNEYCDMYLIYGECHQNALEAARLYATRYPTRRHPSHPVFIRLDRRMRDYGRILPVSNIDAGRSQEYDPRIEEAILDAVTINPSISVRTLARQFNFQIATIHSILRRNDLHPFHLRRVQVLSPDDLPKRVEFCEWLLQRPQNFCNTILWTDEATFTRQGVFNSHNSHIWAVENPRAVRPSHFQTRWSINVWVGIIGSHLIGPYLLPEKMDGCNYLIFLRDVLPDMLDDLPLSIRRNIWFQHDGAPTHNYAAVKEHLNETFPGKWIGRGGPKEWPPRSPDLTPIDFFLWGYLKELMEPPSSPEDLVAQLHAAFSKVEPSMLQRVQNDIEKRAFLCSRNNGQQFEQLL